MERGSRIFVTGHRGLVGSAIVRRLEAEGFAPLTATRQELDLRDQAAVNRWFARERPEYVEWTDIERVDFHRPPAMYPPLGAR